MSSAKPSCLGLNVLSLDEFWDALWTRCSIVWGTYCDLNIKYGWQSEECPGLHDLIGMRRFDFAQRSWAHFKNDFSTEIQIW